MIPHFLRFRIPANGCFETTIVHNFQRRLLRGQLLSAEYAVIQATRSLTVTRSDILKSCPRSLLPSIVLRCRTQQGTSTRTLREKHQSKLALLAERHEKPLRGIHDTVRVLGDIKPPGFGLELLSFRSKHPVLSKFDDVEFFGQFEKCVKQVAANGSNSEDINHLNVCVHVFLNVSYIFLCF